MSSRGIVRMAVLASSLAGFSVFGIAQSRLPVPGVGRPVRPLSSADERSVEGRAPRGPSPEWAIFNAYFLHLENLEKAAAEQDALGRPDDASGWRNYEQQAAKLTDEQIRTIEEVAAACNSEARELDARFEEVRARATGRSGGSLESQVGGAPLAVAFESELTAIADERRDLIQGHIALLRSHLGATEFARLEAYVRTEFGGEVVATGGSTSRPLAAQAGSSIHVYSHTTNRGTQAIAECGTQMVDGFTRANYYSVDTSCRFFAGTTQTASFFCLAGNPNSVCYVTYATSLGSTYSTKADHAVNMLFDPTGIYCYPAGNYYDPVHYCYPETAYTPPDFEESGDAVSQGGPTCWSRGRGGVAQTHSKTITALTISVSPQGKEVLPGQTQTFTAPIAPGTLSQAVVWSILEPNSPVATIDQTGKFTAPADTALTSSATYTVQACSQVDPSACATSRFSVPKITIEILATSPFLATPGAQQTIAAIVHGTTQNLELKWPSLAIDKGTLEPTGNNALYTAPSTPPLAAATIVPLSVCLKDVPTICGSLDLKLVPPLSVAGVSPNQWPAGQHAPNLPVAVTINGSGFGATPTVKLSDPSLVWSLTSAGNTSISGTVSTPLMGLETVTVTVTSVSFGMSLSASYNVVVTPPTVSLVVSPKTVTLLETQTQQFTAVSSCRTAGNVPCAESAAVSFQASVGTIGGSGLYRATATVATQTSAVVTVCATWATTIVACDTATVTLTPIVVTVSPATTSLKGCETRPFTAAVTGAVASTVTWPSPSLGSISAAGVYSAPCPYTPSTPTNVTVKACSTVDGARCGTATATLTPQLTVSSITPNSGPMASLTPVTINGTAFAAGATVTIGGKPATSVVVVSGAVITALTPANPCGPTDVTVTSGGTSVTLTGGFYYTSPPPPTGLSPDGSTLYGVTTATLTWAPVLGATQYAVRVRDETDGTLRDPRNNCLSAALYLCVDGVVGTTYSVPVKYGHSYTWWVHAGSACGQYSVQTTATFAVKCIPTLSAPPPDPTEVIWVDDQVPAGAIARDVWVWDTAQKASGSQSSTQPSQAGIHQHYFDSAPAPFTVGVNDALVAYVLLDPCDPPQEVMLQWWDPVAGWEHRAYWGPDLIQWGTRVSSGALPPVGQWVKLSVPASAVGLAGASLYGMAFTQYGGHMWFDRAGAIRATDNAAFVGQVPPPSCMWPGSTATVSVTMKNTGNTVWDGTYRLGSQNPQDNGTWGLGRVFLAPGETVAPGVSKTFTFTVTMPTTPGTYNFQWRMVHEGVRWFGDFTPNVSSTNTAPAPPTGLSPNGTTFPAGTASVSLSWNPTTFATKWAVRVQDNTDGTLRDPRNNCSGVYLCVNDIASTSYSVPVISGHSYTWWVHAGDCVAYSAQTTATFSVAAPAPPPSPTGLTPNGVALAAGSTSMTMSWTPTPGADRYAVRLRDDTDGSLRSIWSCPGTPTLYLCVNDIGPTSYTSTVVPGHSYTWWVHAGNVYGYSAPTYAWFSVPVAPLHAPTGLYKDSASPNLVWTPPDNIQAGETVTYDLWITGGANCAGGCLYHPGAPSWYTMGAEIGTGTYSWTLKANSSTRASSGAVAGPSFSMP